MSITLANEMAALVNARVACGEYASESEVFREGLRVLMARDNAVEQWLRDKVVPACKAAKQNNDIRSRLKAGHRKATGEE